MVRGTTKAIVGAATAVARTAIAAAPLVGRPEGESESEAGTVSPIAPDQPDAPQEESPAGDPDAGPDLDPAAGLVEPGSQGAGTAAPEDLVVRSGEDPWTEGEVAEVHEELTRRAEELRRELAELDAELDGLIRAPGEGTGQDSADVGSASYERDHEISLGNNARSMLHQTERALQRLAEGSFGVCENCSGAIGKMRVMAFPRATLCLSCKQREERR